MDRLHSYIESTDGDEVLELTLYQWNLAVSSALFHVRGIVEAVIRNAVDREMQKLNDTLGHDARWLAHLEELIPPIHNRDLAHDYQVCLEVLSAISPVVAAWSDRNSGVMQVLVTRPLRV